MDGSGGDYAHLADLEHSFEKTLPPVVPGRVLHIDGDFLPYQCAGNDDVPFPIARQNMYQRIENVKALAGAERAVVHITGPLSDKAKRFDIATTIPYQGQRTHSQRPKNWDGLREVLETKATESHDFVQWDDREADDALTQAAWDAVRGGYTDLCVITSNDKDLRQVSGLYLDWVTGEIKERKHEHHYPAFLQDPEAFVLSSTLKQGSVFHGVWFLLWQMLNGDKTDNIPGCKEIAGTWLLDNYPQECSTKARSGKEIPKAKPCGPALAASLLGALPSARPSLGYQLVKDIYEAHFGDAWVQYFKEQWQLLALYYSENDDRMTLARAVRDGAFDTE